MLLPCYYFSGQFCRYEPLFDRAQHTNAYFAADSFLSPPSSSFDTCYYIKSGLARCYALDDSGTRSTILQFYGAGAIVPCYGENYDLSLEPMLVVQAITPVEAIAIPIKEFGRIFSENPDLAMDVLSYQIRQKNNVIVRLLQLRYSDSYRLVCNMLYLLSSDTGAFDGDSTITFSQESIADICCISRMHVTRVFKELRQKGIISTNRNKIRILDEKALLQSCSYVVSLN